MDTYIDILAAPGREFKKGLHEGELRILGRQIEARFGTIASWAIDRLIAATPEQLEELAPRVLNAVNLNELWT